MRVPVVVYPESSGGFSIVCPTLPGCHSQGETLQEALANVREAVSLYLDVLEEDGLPLPEAVEPLVTSVEVARGAQVP